MKLTFTILFSLISLSCFSQIASVSSGGNIEASKLNELITKINQLNDKVIILENKVLPVGSIVNSLLTLNQYQTENGDCWILANGDSLGVSDELRVITGMTSVPNAYTDGTFLRQAKSGRTLGSFEDESFLSHTHIQNAHNHIQNAHNHTQDAHYHIGGLIFASGWGLNHYGQTAIGSGNYVSPAPTGNTTRAGLHTSSVAATNQASTAVNQASTATNQNSGGTETRPKNIAVNMFVKIKKNCVMP